MIEVNRRLMALILLLILSSAYGAFASQEADSISNQINELRYAYYRNNRQPSEQELRSLLEIIRKTEPAEIQAELTAAWGTLAAETDFPEADLTALHTAHLSGFIPNPGRRLLLSSSDFSTAMYYRTGKGRYLSQAKTYTRKALMLDASAAETRIRSGIQKAVIVMQAGNREQMPAAESALRMLNDGDIEGLADDILRYNAYLNKSRLYAGLLDSGRCEEYLIHARRIFPDKAVVTEPDKRIGTDIRMPYYADFGLKTRTEDYILIAPAAGVGMLKSAFSSSLFVNAGLKYFSNNLGFVFTYRQAFIPDFSCFDFNLLESYAAAEAVFGLKGNTLHAGIKIGRMLNAVDSDSFHDLKSASFAAFGVREEIGIDLMIADTGLNRIGAEITTGLLQLPELSHYAWSISAAVPVSFDLVYCELGFLPRFFHSGYLSDNQEINIGKRHFIYENAIKLGIKDPASLYYRFYETAIAVDGVFRLFTFPLDAPADRIYLGLNGSAGFGVDSRTAAVDFLYAAGISAGFDLNDNTPFEIRLGMDQDGGIFTYMTVVSRISHQF